MMKQSKISAKLNIYDLIPRAFFFSWFWEIAQKMEMKILCYLSISKKQKRIKREIEEKL